MNKSKSAQMIAKAVHNKGLIATTQLVECLVAFIPAKSQANWRITFRDTLSAINVGGTYIDPIVTAKKISATHYQLLRVTDESGSITIDEHNGNLSLLGLDGTIERIWIRRNF